MFMEAGVVVDREGRAFHWHLPVGRSAGSLPDHPAQLRSDITEAEFRRVNLWYVLWENRDIISGFAHSHPGGGIPGPSHEDLTTFAAVEAGLGQRLDWWITSDHAMVVCRWIGPAKHAYKVERLATEPSWVPELRRVSSSRSPTGDQIESQVEGKAGAS